MRGLRAWAGKVQDEPGNCQGLTATDAISKPVVDIYQGAAKMLVIDTERCNSMTQSMMIETERRLVCTAARQCRRYGGA